MFDPLKTCHLMIPQSFKGSIQKVVFRISKTFILGKYMKSFWCIFSYTWHNHAYPHPYTPMDWLPHYLAVIRTKSPRTNAQPWVPKNVSQMTQLEWWVGSHYLLLSVIFSTTTKHFQGTNISHQTGSSEKHLSSNMTWKGQTYVRFRDNYWLQFISSVFQPGSRPHLAGACSSGCHPPSTLMPALSKRMPSLGPGGQKESKQFAAHFEVGQKQTSHFRIMKYR